LNCWVLEIFLIVQMVISHISQIAGIGCALSTTSVVWVHFGCKIVALVTGRMVLVNLML
jgi:hypothetical protein